MSIRPSVRRPSWRSAEENWVRSAETGSGKHLLSFPCLSLPLFEAYARPTTIFVDELEAGGFEGPVQCLDCPFLQFVPPLKPGDRIDRHLGGCREFSDA